MIYEKNKWDPVVYFSDPSEQLVDFAVLTENGKVVEYYEQPCYMNLARACYGDEDDYDYENGCYIEHGKATHVYLGLRRPSLYAKGMDLEDDMNREQDDNILYNWNFMETTGSTGEKDDYWAERLWRYVFDKEYSPWRKAILDPVEYVRDKDGHIIAAKLRVDETILAQTFVSMAMTSRMPWENLGHLRMWAACRDAGFKRYESMYITAHIRFLRNGSDIGFRSVAGHFTFAPYDTDISLKWLKEGTPKSDPAIKLTRDDYGYVDTIWDKQGHRGGKAYAPRGMSSIRNCVLYPILSTAAEYKGSFPKAYKASADKEALISPLGTWDVVLPKLKEHYNTWASVAN